MNIRTIILSSLAVSSGCVTSSIADCDPPSGGFNVDDTLFAGDIQTRISEESAIDDL